MKRLDKLLADLNIGSRSQVKDLIKKGKVTVNGNIVKAPEQKISEEDVITCDGKSVSGDTYFYYMLKYYLDKVEIYGGIKMAFNLKKILSGGDLASEDEYYTLSVEEANKEEAGEGSKMILLEPRAYSESQQIADYLKKRNTVVVNLKRVTPDQGKRIIDFVSGCLYAIGGGMQKLGDGIFLCTPKNINVQGKMTEEEEPKRSRTKNISEDF